MVSGKGAGPDSRCCTRRISIISGSIESCRRQDLQRRRRQCDGLRHSAGAGACVCRCRKGGTPPPHRVYFAAVTAEEQGLLGSEYLGMHPPVPAKDLTLDLNYDMLLPVGVPTSTEVSGAERTTFYPTVESTAKDFNLTIQPDQFPGAGHYYRSDHFSLARYGIPAFSVGQGTLVCRTRCDLGRTADEAVHRAALPSA